MEISSGPLGGPISGPLSSQLWKVRGGNEKSSVKWMLVMTGELTGWQICGAEMPQDRRGCWAKVSHADLVMKGDSHFQGVWTDRKRWYQDATLDSWWMKWEISESTAAIWKYWSVEGDHLLKFLALTLLTVLFAHSWSKLWWPRSL